MNSFKNKDYSIVTELPRTKIPQEQLDRFYQRYFFASTVCRKGGSVLEIACGGGQGLTLLTGTAAKVIAGDITLSNVQKVRNSYTSKDAVFPVQIDGQYLPFGGSSFDAILLFEAIYYFSDVQVLLDECKRVLKPGGFILVGSANKEWCDFNPSPFSVTYYSARQLFTLLVSAGFNVTIYSSYFIPEKRGRISRLVSWLKRIAVRQGLMPKSMKYKALLKRVFIGKFVEFPSRIPPGMCTYIEPKRIDTENYNSQFKVMYALGRLTKDRQG